MMVHSAGMHNTIYYRQRGSVDIGYIMVTVGATRTWLGCWIPKRMSLHGRMDVYFCVHINGSMLQRAECKKKNEEESFDWDERRFEG